MKRVWLVVVAMVVVLAVGVAVVVAGYLRQPSTDEATRFADAFEAPAAWELVAESVRNRAFFCVDGSCPSVMRRWELAAPPTPDQLHDLVAVEDVTTEGDCRPQPNVSGAFVTLCAAEATRGGLQLEVRVSGPAADGPRRFSATLLVEPD
ncbi:hypothetical protein BH20ACT2_BH20ACT2_16950 [soil metagenome]